MPRESNAAIDKTNLKTSQPRFRKYIHRLYEAVLLTILVPYRTGRLLESIEGVVNSKLQVNCAPRSILYKLGISFLIGSSS